PTPYHQKFGAALANHSLGREAASRQALEQMIATDAEFAPYDIGRTYAWRGETEPALQWLERALRTHDPVAVAIRAGPIVASLRADPRFQALLDRFGFPRD